MFENIDKWYTRNQENIVDILLILIVSWVVYHFAHKALQKLLEYLVRKNTYPSKKDRDKRITTLAGLGSAVIKFTVWIVAGLMIMNVLGINTAPLLASASVIGVVVGIGSQKLINDLVSGIFIILENQYRVGDYVALEGVSGTVEDITLRTTVLRDLNGAVHHVPNGAIIVSTNKSMGFGQINLDIAVDPKTNLARLETIINQVGEDVAVNPELTDAIIEPPKFVRVSDFTGNNITVKVMGKTTGGKQLEIKSVFFSELKKSLDKHNIKLAILPSVTQATRK
jgi:small conductance mechanosensitive channel